MRGSLCMVAMKPSGSTRLISTEFTLCLTNPVLGVRVAQLTPGSSLLEVGCGRGKAALPLLQRGFSVTCIELGEGLAGRAEERFEGLPATVHIAPLETWQTDQRFDLAFWTAMHAFPADFDPVFAEIQQVYDELGEGRGEPWPPPPPQDMYDERREVEASGLFDHVEIRRRLARRVGGRVRRLWCTILHVAQALTAADEQRAATAPA